MKFSASCLILIFLCADLARGQITYFGDILGHGFKQATIVQPQDYEGSVTCTIIKKEASPGSGKAVLYVHGFNDYFFQEEMAGRFIAEGYNFYAVDLRKCGRSWLSHQKFNNVRDLSEYFPDIDTTISTIRGEGSNQILLIGHSLGGLVASLYAGKNAGKERFDAVLLNSPFFDPDFLKSGLKKTALPLIVKRAEKHPDTITDSGLSPLYGESLHSSAHGEWNYSLGFKPLIAPPVNFGWVRAVHLGQQRLAQGLQINRPVLVMHSTKSVEPEKKWNDALLTGDAVLNVSAISLQAQNIVGQYSIVTVAGGMHDLVLSKKSVREEVYSTMLNWAKRVVK